MNYVIALIAAGLATGAIYGLVAIGFAIIYKATGIINFAQGEMVMLNAYLGLSIATFSGVGFWALVPLVVLASILVGLAVEFLLVRPMLGEPAISIVMMTVGLAVCLRSLVILIWGAEPQVLPVHPAEDVVQILGARLYSTQILAIVCLALVVVGFFVFYRHTRSGLAMRASSSNETVALLMGIDVRRIYALAWGLASVTGGLAGLLVATIYELGPDMFAFGLRSFPAVILGGLDSAIGAAVGGAIIGVLENLGEGYIGRGLKEIVGFVVILMVLMVRPYGMFGTRDVERV